MPLDFKKKRRDGSTAPSRKPSRPPAQDTHARRSSNERHGSITRGFSKDGRRSSTGKSADGLYPSAAPKPIMKGSGRRPKSGRRARNLTEEVATHRLQRWWRTSRILSALSAGLYLRTLEQIHHDERLAVVRAHLAKQVLGRFFNSLANQKANRELRRQDRDQNRSLPLIAAFMMARSASKEVTQRRAAKYKDAVAVIEDYWRRSALFIRVQSMSTNERAQRIFCQQEHIERRELFRQRLLFLIERHQEFFNAAIMREATLGTRMIPSTVRSVILFSKGFIDGDDGVFEVDERKVCGTGSYHPYYGLERRGDVDAIKQLERHIFFSAEERHLLAEERIFSTGRAVGPGFARGKVSRAMRHPQVYRFIYNYRSVLESVEERASPILSGGRRTPKVPISEGARALSQLQKDLQPPTLRRDPAVLLKLMEEQGSVLVPHIVGASFVAESRRQEGYLPSSSSLPMEEEEEPSPSSPARATMHTESIYSLTSTSLPGKPHQSLIVSKYSECASSFQEYLGTMWCRGLRQLNRLSTGTSVSSDHVELVLRSCTDPIQKMFFDPLGRFAADGSAAAVSSSGTGAGDATNAPSATVSARSTAGDGSSIKPPWSSKHTISASLLGPHWMHFYQKHYDSFLAMEREPPAEKSQPRCVSSRTALDGAKSFSPCPRDTASPMGVSRRMSLFSTEQQVGGAEVPTHRQKERLSMVLGNPTTRRTFTLQSLARDASRREDVGYSRRMLSPSMADDDELGGVAGLRPDTVSPAYLLPRLSMAPPNKSSLFSGSHYELRQEDTMYEFHLAYNVERLLAQENVIRISIRRGWRSQWVSLQKLSLINQREIEHELSTRY